MAVTGMRHLHNGFRGELPVDATGVLRLGESAFDIVMEVENLSAAPMDLMYLRHVNFAFAPSARIVTSSRGARSPPTSF
jgi:hypothetical protein